MEFEEEVSWEGKTIHIYLSFEQGEFNLQVVPYGNGNSYVTAGQLDQFRIGSILSWAKQLGYTELFRSELNAKFNVIFSRARSLVPN